MKNKDTIADLLTLRHGLDEADAAAYLSLSLSKFRQLVMQGAMPRPRLAGRRWIWDAEILDRCFRDLLPSAGNAIEHYAKSDSGPITGARLKHIDRFIDRHGKPRYYYRPDKGARVPLHGAPDSAEFMRAYYEAARNDNRQAVTNQSETTARSSCVEGSGVSGDPPKVGP